MTIFLYVCCKLTQLTLTSQSVLLRIRICSLETLIQNKPVHYVYLSIKEGIKCSPKVTGH